MYAACCYSIQNDIPMGSFVLFICLEYYSKRHSQRLNVLAKFRVADLDKSGLF